MRRDHPFWQAIINLRHGHGLTRLMLVAGPGRLASVETLIAWHADVHMAADISGGRTALMWAVCRSYIVDNGNIMVVRALLAAGAGVDSVDSWGQTALLLASRYGRVEAVRALLTAGASKHLIARGGATAYICASSRPEKTATIRALLDLAP